MRAWSCWILGAVRHGGKLDRAALPVGDENGEDGGCQPDLGVMGSGEMLVGVACLGVMELMGSARAWDHGLLVVADGQIWLEGVERADAAGLAGVGEDGDRVEHVILVILGGLDRAAGSLVGARRRQPWLPALLRVMEHHTGAPVVHRKSCTCNVYFAI
ncbi:hypothetical protein ACLOJK_041041 [Asimina triloba]